MSEHYEDVFVHAATVGSLAQFLNTNVPYVWSIGHMPNTTIEWWRTDVPLNKTGTRIEADVRVISYDLQLSTNEFLENVAAFDRHGLTLVQSYKRMPNTFELHRVLDDTSQAVLRQNRAFLFIELPHAVETALVRCFEPGYLSQFTAA